LARKSSPTISQEELYTSVDEPARPDLDDARLVSLDVDEESPFLRGQRRVSVRRGPLPKKTAHRLLWTLAALAIAGLATIAAGAIYRYSEHSWRFRIDSSEDIEISGTHNVSHAQVLDIFGGDIGRNIFFVPLAQRKAQLEQVPWVDAAGVLMELPLATRRKFSFPVIVGMSASEPLSTRAARMKTYNDLMRQLDSAGGHYSQDLSEVDLSDGDDVKVVANDPQGAVLVHLGSTNFLERYKVYVSHLQEWRQQFNPVESVDLRYDRQIIVNPDLRGVKQAPLSTAATRVAVAAGVKPAALVAKVGGTKLSVPPVRHSKLSPWKKPARKHWTKAKTKAPLTAHASPLPVITSAPPKPATVAPVTANSELATGKKKPSPAISKAKDQGAQ
jgi:cell division protein FtsQ